MKKRFPELEEQLLDAYYKFKGWNNDGVPTKETLEALDLGYIAEDLNKEVFTTKRLPPKRLQHKRMNKYSE